MKTNRNAPKSAEQIRQNRVSAPADRVAEETRRNRAASRKINAWRKRNGLTRCN